MNRQVSSNQQGVALNNQDMEDTIIHLAEVALSRKASSIKLDAPLFSSQTGFDSFSLMEFVLHLEETFNISIPDEDLDPDVFHSVKTIATYVRRRLAQEG